MAEAPTIFALVGGETVFRSWLDAFYDLVERDELLGPLFGGNVSEEHRAHVTDWWCEVMGGPAELHRAPRRLRADAGQASWLAITDELRLRFVTLLSRAADVAGVPASPNAEQR